jgi:hypothetical protein
MAQSENTLVPKTFLSNPIKLHCVGLWAVSLATGPCTHDWCRWIVAAATAPRCFARLVAGAFVAFYMACHTYSVKSFWSTYTCRRRQGMAPTLFEAASCNIGLMSKTRAALEASCDEAWCRQSVSDLQLLEAVLSQVKNISRTTTSDETIRTVGFCELACAPSLKSFLEELEKLQPDLDRYFVAGEDRSSVGGPPPWATTVERNTVALMNNIGMQLQLTNAFLRVESLGYHTTSGGIQCTSKIPSDRLSLAAATNVPSQQYIMAGNENVYQGIQISGSARAHIGESYSYLGVPKASVDKLSEKLDDLATSGQADSLQSLLRDIQKRQSDEYDVVCVLDTQTQQVLEQLKQLAHAVAIAIANGAPSLPTNATPERLHETTPKRPGPNQLTSLSHLLTHTERLGIGRPHICDKCGRRFARVDQLARHNPGPGGYAGQRLSHLSVDGEDGIFW